jgi:hypothetical protein
MLNEGFGPSQNYDVARDGRFLVILQGSQRDVNSRSSIQLNVVLNWLEELKQRVPVK